MNPTDPAFKNLARVFLDGILARTPPMVTPEERLFLDYLRKCDNEGHFDQTSAKPGKQITNG